MAVAPVQIHALDTGTVTLCRISPFLARAPAMLTPAAGAAATVYRVEHPGTADLTRYAAFHLDGETTELEMPAGLNPLDDTATELINEGEEDEELLLLSDAQRLMTVVLVNGAPIVRVCSDEVPAAGECSATDTGTLVLGSTYDAGTVVEVFAFLLADVSNTGSIAARAHLAESCLTFYTASAPCALEPAGRAR